VRIEQLNGVGAEPYELEIPGKQGYLDVRVWAVDPSLSQPAAAVYRNWTARCRRRHRHAAAGYHRVVSHLRLRARRVSLDRACVEARETEGIIW
jgi:hypothetical protein